MNNPDKSTKQTNRDILAGFLTLLISILIWIGVIVVMLYLLIRMIQILFGGMF